MTSREIFKKSFAGYKRVEKLFFRADKNKEKADYKKLKYEFRMTSIISILNMLISLPLLILYGQFPPTPFPLLVSVLIGFRFKFYNLPRAMAFVVATTIPIKFYSDDLIFAVPAAILVTNGQLMLLTQSESFSLVHLIIQTFVFYFYGMERLTQKIQSMTAEEIAKVAQAAFYACIMTAWASWVVTQRFYAHTSRLLRKIGALKDNISKVNSQLNDQNLKLQSNLEMKDIFISTFSHELKNALNGLLGNLTLAYDTAKDSQMLRFISSAKVCGEVLKNFVHNILDSGKLENGNLLEVSPEKQDVMRFMENIWTICGRIIENKRLKGCLKIDKNVPRYLDLDEQRMAQIVLNLVSNSAKFTEKGQVRIHVSWQTMCVSSTQHDLQINEASEPPTNRQSVGGEEEGEADYFGGTQEHSGTLEGFSPVRRGLHLSTDRPKKFLTDPQFYRLTLDKWHWNREETLPSDLREGAKGTLRVQVLDTGCGITSEDQTMLFKRFSQTNKVPGQRKVGTGLGLWICKELAKRLDGEIKIRSAVGVGSVFELNIHTKVSAPVIKHQPTLSHDSDSSPRRAIRKQRPSNMMKILIADDDSFNIELMRNYLNKFGISYLVAHDGEEAVSLFKQQYEDICFVITDNFMPKKLGIEAALEIAEFLEEMNKPKIPIVCVSGDVKLHIGESGITSVIQKPINFDRLKEELRAFFPQIDST